MKGVSFGQYYPADSIIHKMDPRFKILLATVFIVATFLCKSAVSFLALLCIGLSLIFISKIPLRRVSFLKMIRFLRFSWLEYKSTSDRYYTSDLAIINKFLFLERLLSHYKIQ